MKKLYCYSQPNTMDGYKRKLNPGQKEYDCHRYTDDVALCMAESLEDAVRIFSFSYNYENIENHIEEVNMDLLNSGSIYIATDY